MVKVELGKFGSMIKIIRAAKNNKDFSIAIRGWRKRTLLPKLLEQMPEAIKTNLGHEEVSEIVRSTWSPLGIWVGWWLGPILSIYKLSIESGADVSIIGGEPTVLYFKYGK